MSFFKVKFTLKKKKKKNFIFSALESSSQYNNEKIKRSRWKTNGAFSSKEKMS